MAKAKFTLDEMVYNSIINGKQIYYNDELKTIDYVKLVKNTRQVQIICQPDISGNTAVFLVNQDDALDFEINNPKPFILPNLPKLKKN